ncbi:MAG: helix-turn-helix domain-containing protein [Thermoleophilaceae bacterium]|jgi:excisionase family DNA binding protein
MQNERKPLYVRLPALAAQDLDRAAFELKTSKQDLVSGLVSRYVDPDSPRKLAALGRIGGGSPSRQGGTRRVVVETADDSLTVGHASFVPAHDADVLTTAEAADLLRTDEETVEAMAKKGELPGRKLGDDWRFTRTALLRWLGGAEDEED